MKVSVIIPAYNEAEYIGKCIESLQDQTRAPGEIIVVDNNSSDNTADIARELGATVVRERRQGVTNARNRGFDEAQFEILARTDADTIVPNDWIEKIIHNFETKDIDALSGPYAYHDGKLVPHSPLVSIVFLEMLRILTFGKRFFLGGNMALTKRMWLRVRDIAGADDTKVHDDIDLSIKIIKRGGRIGFDRSLVTPSSARRIENDPFSFFVGYPIRLVRTFWVNR